MPEPKFNDTEMTLNSFQDPMGRDSHSGLERFLSKFHQPTVPSHTIITDPEYSVYLWFHDANGKLIDCPYTNGGYTPVLKWLDVKSINSSFIGKYSILGGGEYASDLPEKCLDLTPFVHEAQLPEIAPANGEQIQTLFGNTTAGSFSPYASDGSKSITLQMLDTEYSILDAIFYPWMRDINSPWWYNSSAAFSEWATPYPMATLEIQRPRMRYREDPLPGISRADQEYEYYSYKFLGVKPTSYAGFAINGNGPSTFNRSLTFICDMCLVDLVHDAQSGANGGENLGVRKNFIFESKPNLSSDDTPDASNDSNDSGNQDDMTISEQDLQDLADQVDGWIKEVEENERSASAQGEGDQPGEEVPETPTESDKLTEGDGGSSRKISNIISHEKTVEYDPIQSASIEDYNRYGPTYSQMIGKLKNERMLSKNQKARHLYDLYDVDDQELVECVQEEISKLGNQISYESKTSFGWMVKDIEQSGLSANALLSAIGVSSSIKDDSAEQISPNLDTGYLEKVSGITQSQFGTAYELSKYVIKSGKNNVEKPKTKVDEFLNMTFEYRWMKTELNLRYSTPIDNVAFGVVSGQYMRGTYDTNVSIGGILDDSLYHAYPFFDDVVSNCGNIIGGIVDRIYWGDILNEHGIQGLISQYIGMNNTVKSMDVVSGQLNQAMLDIFNGLDFVDYIYGKIEKAQMLLLVMPRTLAGL